MVSLSHGVDATVQYLSEEHLQFAITAILTFHRSAETYPGSAGGARSYVRTWYVSFAMRMRE